MYNKKKKKKVLKYFRIVLLILLVYLIILIFNYNKKNKSENVELNLKQNQYNQQFEEYLSKKKELLQYVDNGMIVDKKDNFVYLSNVPSICQFPELPTGCETVALLIMLKYYNIDVDWKQIIDELPREKAPYTENGVNYGGDPSRGFLGNPTEKSGYGVYEQPIMQVANKFKSGIKSATGTDLTEILKIIDTGNPVQVWVSIDVTNMYYYKTWIDNQTGKTIKWPSQFHSLVIVGYDNNNIITSDPDTGTIRAYDKEQFEKVYNFFGKRAIYYEN